MRFFPALQCDVTSVFDVTDSTESQSCVQVTEQMYVDWNRFCHRLFLSRLNYILMKFSKLSPQEKVGLLAYAPVYF